MPLFISRNAFRLERGRRSYPRAAGQWALDSGGFTELASQGRWRAGVKQFVAEVRTIQQEVGNLVFAAPQDWMCEPQVVEGGMIPTAPKPFIPGTGLDVREHQYRTVHNFLELRALAPDVPWIPVLQGWAWGQYDDIVEEYDRAGVDLRKEALVGLGSVCRRQDSPQADLTIHRLRQYGLRLHAFGFNTPGLLRSGADLASADSLAWSLAGRLRERAGTAPAGARNDLMFALQWRADLFARLREAGVRVS